VAKSVHESIASLITARYDRNLRRRHCLVYEVNETAFFAARLDIDLSHIRQVGYEFDELVAVSGVDEGTGDGCRRR